MTIQHLRSSTANKRPTPAAMSDGQLAVNTNTASPGLFFKDSAGALIKVGPVHVGTTAPNASPASGGETGNTVGEQWLDTAGGTYVFKVWDGSAWRSETGTFVDVNGDVMTGALGIIAGSAGSPGLYFSGDTNTGLYSPGADQVAISTGGSGRLFVDASGNIGVGTATTNWSLLDGLIVQTGNGYAGINIASSSATDNAYLAFGYGTTAAEQFSASVGRVGNNTLVFGTNNTERLRITSAGLVGVGTSSPSALLTVSSGEARFDLNATNASGRLWNIYSGGGGNVGAGAFSIAEGGSTQRFVIVGGGSGEAMRIDASNRVGVGTTTPDQTLVVNGGVGINNGGGSGGSPILTITNASGSPLVNATNNASALTFGYNGTEAFRVDSSRRLLVGTSSSAGAHLLQIQGNTNSSASSGSIALRRGQTNPGVEVLGEIVFTDAAGSKGASIEAISDLQWNNNDYPTRLVFSVTQDGSASPTEAMRINNKGQIGINYTGQGSGRGLFLQGSTSNSADYTLYLINSANTRADFGIRNDGFLRSEAAYIQTSASAANVFIDANGFFYRSTSSRRYKRDIAAAPYTLEKIDQLRAVNYKTSSPNADGEVSDQIFGGLIAEEVNEAGFEEFVVFDEQGRPDALQYGQMIAVAIKGLQEAHARIKDLEAKVAALEAA